MKMSEMHGVKHLVQDIMDGCTAYSQKNSGVSGLDRRQQSDACGKGKGGKVNG